MIIMMEMDIITFIVFLYTFLFPLHWCGGVIKSTIKLKSLCGKYKVQIMK